MNYAEIVSEIQGLRFNSSQQSSIRLWIQQAHQQVWVLADWPWKRIGPSDLALTAGDNTPTMPSDFQRPYNIYDENGQWLEQLSPDDFDKMWLSTTLGNFYGAPSHYKWVNGVVTLGPTPDTEYTYSMAYESMPCYLAGGTTRTTGVMTADSDEPIWDSVYHYVLVHGAYAIGQRTMNDPTYAIEDEIFQQQVNSMIDHYLPTHSPMTHIQYGADWDQY